MDAKPLAGLEQEIGSPWFSFALGTVGVWWTWIFGGPTDMKRLRRSLYGLPTIAPVIAFFAFQSPLARAWSFVLALLSFVVTLVILGGLLWYRNRHPLASEAATVWSPELTPSSAAPLAIGTWDPGELGLVLRRPLYSAEGQFLVDLTLSSPVPFPSNSKLKALLVEVRYRGTVLGQYRYTGPTLFLVGRSVKLGKALVVVKEDVFPVHVRAEASRIGRWEVEIDVRIQCELVVPGISDSGPYDLYADAQFCGVRDSFSSAELRDILPKDLG